MTLEQMDKVIQEFCEARDYLGYDELDLCNECQINYLCCSIKGEFINHPKECLEAYTIIKELTKTPDETAEPVKDNVNHPSHYETGKFECIEVMREALGEDVVKGFCLGNAFKYLYRCNHKHQNPLEDVRKAIWYLDKFVDLEGE